MRGFRLGCLAVALAAALLTTQRASAQGERAADTDARAMFEQGRTAYDEGRFEDAVRSFRRAYVLSTRFALLYNVGQAELRAGHEALALEAFEGFLRQAPSDDARRAEVEERVRVLRPLIGAITPAEPVAQATAPSPGSSPATPVAPDAAPVVEPTPPASTTPAVVAPSGSSSGPGVAPWIVVGVSGAVAIAGAALVGVASSEAGRVTGAPEGARWADLSGVASGAESMWGAGLALVGIGVVGLGVGVIWGVTGPRDEAGSAPSARLRVGPGGLTCEGAF